MRVTRLEAMNEIFAQAFNSHNIENLLGLYEADAVLHVDGSGQGLAGIAAIAGALRQFLQVPGTMTSRNNFCVVRGDIALLRADWRITGADGAIVAEDSTAEIVRRQPDGRWLYVVDHAAAVGLPRVD
jgi:uncharacterized protein (TIGR02246 family)